MLLPALMFPAYWWLSYSGPYRWIAEAQLNMFGSYIPALTGAFTFLLLVGSGMGVLALISWRLVVTDQHRRQEAAAETRQLAFLRRHGWFLTASVLAITLGGFGVYNYAVGKSLGALRDVDVEAIEAGEWPPSRFVQLAGKLRKWDGMTLAEEHQSKRSVVHYYPIGSVPDSTAPAAVVLRIQEEQIQSAPHVWTVGTYVGTLRKLPPFVAAELEKQGVVLAERVWLLEYLNGPGHYLELGTLFMIAGALAVLAALIAHVLSRRRVQL